MCVRYPCGSGRQVAVTAVRQSRRRRTWLDSPIQAQMFEDARNDTGVGNDSNHLQLAATIGAPAQINGEYPLQSRQPAHWRSARIGRGFIGAACFARYLGACHDARSLGSIGRKYSVVTMLGL